MKFIFNYYLVLKQCWVIILFQFIGYLAFVKFEQGLDIIGALHISDDTPVSRVHTIAFMVSLFWWSWQSWRAARTTLHLTHFDFPFYSRNYTYQAQVIIPRLLGMFPFIIAALGFVKATSWSNPLVYLCLSAGLWMYVIYYTRKTLILLFIRKVVTPFFKSPDYILVKNDAYPVRFVWKKQNFMVLSRMLLIILVFILILTEPINFPQKIGSSAIVSFALGAWLVLGSFVNYLEKYYRFPFSFTLVILVAVFSFFNNNHKISTLNEYTYRLPLNDHFIQWYKDKYKGDTVTINLIAAQGGGARSAYWTASVLDKLNTLDSNFHEQTYGYSCVSGGSLGVIYYEKLMSFDKKNVSRHLHTAFSSDFLSPVTAGMVFPDLVQKFIPYPVQQFDRAKILEQTFERTLTKITKTKNPDLATELSDTKAIFLNATKAESGKKVILSNIETNPKIFYESTDLMQVTQKNIHWSGAIGLSSRFPFLTPPGLVLDHKNETWGNIVDGGYIDNTGGETLLDLYDFLIETCKRERLKTKINLIFIKNTKSDYETKISGLHEILVPIKTFSMAWVNNANYTEESSKFYHLRPQDKVKVISLPRKNANRIPLGWYLSPKTVEIIYQESQKIVYP